MLTSLRTHGTGQIAARHVGVGHTGSLCLTHAIRIQPRFAAAGHGLAPCPGGGTRQPHGGRIGSLTTGRPRFLLRRTWNRSLLGVLQTGAILGTDLLTFAVTPTLGLLLASRRFGLG
ncbi:MAG: hypothetical protein ACU4EP_01505 [Candidatus Nitrosoglobus sp.]